MAGSNRVIVDAADFGRSPVISAIGDSGRPPWSIGGASVRLVIVSPHCDDAAFALGGMLSTLGPEACGTVVTCFSRSDYAWESHSPSVETVTATRMAEDHAWVRRLALVSRARVTVAHLGLDDAPLRLGLRGAGLYMSAMPLSQVPVARTIAAALATLATDGAMLIAPLGIGGHVDHLVARRAVEMCAGDTARTLYYEDQPYAARAPRQVRRATRGYRLASRTRFSPAAKADLLRCYPSQIDAREIDAIVRYAVHVFLRRHPGRVRTFDHPWAQDTAAPALTAVERLWRQQPPRRHRISGCR
ncbi:MAG: PIG-L family deacetylase [Burkholderiales bacterium]|nr:PIG-L family deacetylase [Burkholderiales bacterium]